MKELERIIGYLHDSDSLHAMRFQDTTVQWNAADFECSQDTDCAGMLLAYVAALAGSFYEVFLMYTHSMPGKLCALLHDSEATVTATLRDLEHWWNVLEEAEKEMLTSRVVKGCLDECIWPLMPWYRSILLRLAEVSFGFVPQTVRSELMDFVSGFPGTKVVEDLHRHLRAAGDKSASGQLSRSMRWVRSLDSDMLADTDRPRLVATVGAKKVASSMRVGPELFDPEVGNLSVPKRELSEILQSTRPWPSPSPEVALRGIAMNEATVLLFTVLLLLGFRIWV